jgi:hypothetical protein
MAKVISKNEDKIVLELTHDEAVAIGCLCSILSRIEIYKENLSGHKKLWKIMLSYMREYK